MSIACMGFVCTLYLWNDQDTFLIHYNFIREHGSIKMTPAEHAGIKLDLGQNKIESLMRMASKNRTHGS